MRWFAAVVTAIILASFVFSLPVPSAKGIVFPSDPNAVIDVKRDLGAKGDGVHDDTDALQRGIWLSSGHDAKNTKVLYIPNGVYRVTRKLIVNRPEDRSGIGPWI
ncbi:MAG: glycoside hydrolase family 55 protein, partial [Armatimonadetes bacterium]|nr:glycoside hydrolase family 55 protein [Armatimonadota bacterium]